MGPAPVTQCSGVWLRVIRCDHLTGHIMSPPPGQVSPQWTPGLPSAAPLGQLSPWASDAFYQRLSPTRDPKIQFNAVCGVENRDRCWAWELSCTRTFQQLLHNSHVKFLMNVENYPPWFPISWETAFIAHGRGRDVARPDLISATQEGRLVITWHCHCLPWPGPPWRSPQDNT